MLEITQKVLVNVLSNGCYTITIFIEELVRKRIVVKQINRKKVKHGVYLKEDRLLNKTIIFSDESQVVIGQNNRAYVWRSAQESCHPKCMYAAS